jgi:hypothetical protein
MTKCTGLFLPLKEHPVWRKVESDTPKPDRGGEACRQVDRPPGLQAGDTENSELRGGGS